MNVHNNLETGAPLNGALAYVRGFSVDACPFDPGDPGCEPWIEAYSKMAAAHARDVAQRRAEADAASAPTIYSGNIVKPLYRQRYARMGHPRHCGDELAELLNRLCLVDDALNLEVFEAIMDINGVDISMYNRTRQGWEGRLRMTGRNKLAAVVRAHDGQVKMPPHISDGAVYQLSDEWIRGSA